MDPIVVIGAGAAGLVAAITAADGSRPVIVVERTADGGRKILISGGGRCNILPSVLAPDRFVTDSPAPLLRGMLRAWPLARMRQFFEDDVGIPLALEEDTGKLFPASNRARDVRDGLVDLARRRGVTFQFNTTLQNLARDDHGWIIETSSGALRASAVVLATGGLSVPATGSDGTGLDIAAALGHRVHETYPALTPITCESGESWLRPADLAGVSLTVRLRAKWHDHTTESHGGFLFTHRGCSGPSVLDVSHVCVRSRAEAASPRAVLRASWSALDATAWDARLRASDVHVATVLARELPERLAHALVAAAGIPRDRRTSSLTRSERLELVAHLTACELPWTGDEGYKKAEVTGGGIALTEVDPRTLESRRAPRLFLCGEILDAFGPIGGHNFAWAWATGYGAGRGAERC
ncbi:MAG: aminoacetone oxidase family FAD-binding enzyme [Acidobacteria bacterium]|nr:aminoacetone oxidase family FAD-binding enzyme [Acidobacteriota bacterium]